MEYVFSIELDATESVDAQNIRKYCLDMGLKWWSHDDEKCTQVVECTGEHVPHLLVLVKGHRFLMAPLAHPMREDGMCAPYEQSMYTHFSRRANARWWQSVDWFERHRAEFKAGEFIVMRDAVLLHRTNNKSEHYKWLCDNGDPHTLAHEMVRDGVEMKYSL